jgi:UDP:flavonoid glycosyltransferase YjiC (YdhE family)
MALPKKILLFAPCAFNLAETTRMVEIAKAVERHPKAREAFAVHFISDGGDFEALIERHGFALTRMEPRLTKEKIEQIAKVDRGERFAPAFTDREMITRVENELVCLGALNPVAVVTGSYVTIPLTCRILQAPLVWVIQSTWLPGFFRHGAGMTDHVRPAPLKWIADWFILQFINFWVRYGFLNPVNRAAKHFDVRGYDSIFEFWRGDITLVAEPPEFSGATLPPDHYFIGPLVPQDEFPMPDELAVIPRSEPLIYFAMGSSGTPEIVGKIVESFEGTPYRVIAPVKFLLALVPGVRVPPNVIVTDWVPAVQVNRLADLAVIHGGIGTVMTAALAGKPVVGVGMQIEQVANLACLERLGFAIRVRKSKDPSRQIQAAIEKLLRDPRAKEKAAEFAEVIARWDGPKLAADLLFQHFGAKNSAASVPSDGS